MWNSDPHRSADSDVNWHGLHYVSQSEAVPRHGGRGEPRRDLERNRLTDRSDTPMESTHAIADTLVKSTIPSKLRDYYALTKPEVNLLILMTTSAGYYLGSSGVLRVGRLLLTLLGTLLVASGTATLNQLMERRYDAQMRRTANRPLVSGRLSSREAGWFGLVLSAAGGVLLGASVNVVSALLAIGTLLGYLLVYTPLKRKTPLCTLLGAVPGAMPTLIGWAAASGGNRTKCVAAVRSPISLAVPSFPGNRAAIPGRLRGGWLSDVASVRCRWPLHQGGDRGIRGLAGNCHYAAFGGPKRRCLLPDHAGRRNVFCLSHGQTGLVGLSEAGWPCRSRLGDLLTCSLGDDDGLERVNRSLWQPRLEVDCEDGGVWLNRPWGVAVGLVVRSL